MPVRKPAIRLGEADVGNQRHVCALLEGPEDAARLLTPFVLQGLERGDRVVHVVEHATAYLRRLGRHADVSAAVESGQLDVRTWEGVYLSSGRFRASTMLTYIRRLLREGPGLGFSATRIIGDMEWARDGVPGVEDLVAYERGLDRILARPQTVAVCAYDVRRHSGSRIAEILEAHQAAVVGGRLQPISRSDGTSPRERVLAAAALLFAEHGVTSTGVDTLIDAAGVAKATFYRHFPSKDALVVAWLQDPQTRWFDRVRAQAEAKAGSPAEVILRFFEAVAEWLEADDYLGCPYLNTSIEISDAHHPASMPIRAHLAEIGRYLGEQAAAAGHPDTTRLGRELHALLAGSISLAVANRTSRYALAARDAAMQLLDVNRARLT
jgi:AcrR family transcriptional regulator